MTNKKQSELPIRDSLFVTVSQYAEDLISIPRAHVRMEFSQDEMGMLLTHDNNLLVRCPLTEYGMAAAGFMSEAMGIKVPALGTSLSVRVSTGVLFRVISIAELDYSVEESITILTRLLEEAELQRGRSSGSE